MSKRASGSRCGSSTGGPLRPTTTPARPTSRVRKPKGAGQVPTPGSSYRLHRREVQGQLERQLWRDQPRSGRVQLESCELFGQGHNEDREGEFASSGRGHLLVQQLAVRNALGERLEQPSALGHGEAQRCAIEAVRSQCSSMSKEGCPCPPRSTINRSCSSTANNQNRTFPPASLAFSEALRLSRYSRSSTPFISSAQGWEGSPPSRTALKTGAMPLNSTASASASSVH